MEVQIEASWKALLQDEFAKPYFREIVQHIKAERAMGETIYPPGKYIFEAFTRTPVDQVKVVILGQDPYHQPGQAHGLSFSVADRVKLPPSLVNIYKELETDLGIRMPAYFGNLSQWADQGVLLLNTALTVRANEPASHSKIGWSTFTDAVIQTVSDKKSGLVFLLWGRHAQAKRILIDTNKHLILEAAHPSPFSADKGFFGCRHFSRANAFLVARNNMPINWQLTPTTH